MAGLDFAGTKNYSPKRTSGMTASINLKFLKENTGASEIFKALACCKELSSIFVVPFLTANLLTHRTFLLKCDRLGREAAEKSKERAEARAQKLELELKAQKASTQKLEAALKNNFVNDNADEDDDDHEPVFLTGEGIESPKRNNNQE